MRKKRIGSRFIEDLKLSHVPESKFFKLTFLPFKLLVFRCLLLIRLQIWSFFVTLSKGGENRFFKIKNTCVGRAERTKSIVFVH